MRLTNVQSIHSRVESFVAPPGFDAIVSRAFAALAGFVGRTDTCCDLERRMAMKAEPPQDEIAALPPDVGVFHVEQLAFRAWKGRGASLD